MQIIGKEQQHSVLQDCKKIMPEKHTWISYAQVSFWKESSFRSSCSLEFEFELFTIGRMTS